jgi:hypothetical protein
MVGNDWIMESTGDNIKNLYFTDNINNYIYSLDIDPSIPILTPANFTPDLNNPVNITSGNIPSTLSSNTLYVLTENISVSSGFTVDGSNIIFDGNNNVITITQSFSGLFNNTVYVKNLGVIPSDNSVILDNQCGWFFTKGDHASGIIINGLAEKCYSTGNIPGSGGGIFGYACYGIATDCYSTGNIVGEHGGGIIGLACQGIMTNCYSTGNINEYNGGFAGGIFGSLSDWVNGRPIAINCYSTGNIGPYGGGIFGINLNGTATNCYSTGSIGQHAGGIFAYGCYVNATNCYSRGSIGENGGGISGSYVFGTGTATNCYSEGNMGVNAGGIFGYNTNGTATNCYSIGNIGIAGGGIFGYNPRGTAINCHSSGDINLAGGGIFGQFAGNGNVVIALNCYSTGIMNGMAGGIYGQAAGVNGGNAYAINCYSTGNINSGDIYSADPNNFNGPFGAGGIFGNYTGNTNGTGTAINCYSTGIVNGIYAGGIFGDTAGVYGGTGIAVNCYSSGSLINDGNEIFGDNSPGYIGNSSQSNSGHTSGWDNNNVSSYLINNITNLLSISPSVVYDLSSTICPLSSPYNNTIWLEQSTNIPWLLVSYNNAIYSNNDISGVYPSFSINSDSLSLNVISDISYNTTTIINTNDTNNIDISYNTNPFTISNIPSGSNYYLTFASVDISNTMYSVNLINITATTPIPAPQSINISDGYKHLEVSFTPPSSFDLSSYVYSVYYSNDNSNNYVYTNQSINTITNNFIITDLSHGVLYTVLLSAVNNNNIGTPISSSQYTNGFDTYDINGIIYEILVDSSNANVFDTTINLQSTVSIPNYIAYSDLSYNIIGIANNAFYDCSNIISLTIPNTVVNIGSGAFESCTNLKLLTIPSSITSIGDTAFIYSGIISLNFNTANNITSLGSTLFDNYNNIDIYLDTSNNIVYDYFNITTATIYIPPQITDITTIPPSTPSGTIVNYNGTLYQYVDISNSDLSSNITSAIAKGISNLLISQTWLNSTETVITPAVLGNISAPIQLTNSDNITTVIDNVNITGVDSTDTIFMTSQAITNPGIGSNPYVVFQFKILKDDGTFKTSNFSLHMYVYLPTVNSNTVIIKHYDETNTFIENIIATKSNVLDNLYEFDISGNETLEVLPQSGSSAGDPLIKTIDGTSYYLPHNDGLYLLFDNMNNNDRFKVIAECLKLSEKEIKESVFHNFLLDNTTFMTKLYIHINNETIEFDMNKLTTKDFNSKIVLGSIYNDKYVFKKNYSDNKIKRFNIKFNGKSINIKVKGKTLEYNLKASVDLGCADHRNEVTITGPYLSTGYGAIVSQSHKSLLLQYNV